MFQRILLALVLLISAGLSAGDVAATLLKASGTGQIYQPDGSQAEFKAGTLVRAGSRIVTSEGALALLMMDDGSRVSVGPNTDLTLSESKVDGETRSTVFDLVRGLFKATVQKLTVGSRFNVKTPDAVAAVKGTSFAVLLDGKGTQTQVEEGTVWLENARGERAVLKARMSARAERNGRLEEPRRMTEDELKHFGDWARASVAPHSGALLPADQAKREAWLRLRPEQRRRVLGDLAESLGDTWSDITLLTAEERQERWRDRLRANDELRLAAEGARVDFALGKTALDRQGRRVRFDEFIVRPAANQIQFLNYTRRDNRTDQISNINTYNRALPQALSEAPGLNQRVWLQGNANPPQYWLVSNALVAGNNLGDSFALSTTFYDPYFRPLGYWELPIRDMDARLNIPDLLQPRSGGIQVEYWTRQYSTVLDLANSVAPINGGLTPVNGGAAVAGRGVPGSSNNLPVLFPNAAAGNSVADINNTNLVWSLGDASTTPITIGLTLDGLEAQPGDVAAGFKRIYRNAGALGKTFEFRTYVIDENGQIVNLTGVNQDNLMEEFVNRSLITSLNQIEIRSSDFHSGDGINVVSKLLFLHDLTKSRDQL